ncbi:MAG: ABC transporter substrate-binding protein [Chloroflexi bacterium]|nr:ABC transporter substrate-binding protein [Chloroflexota bacterium]MCL5075255.1 ABC transporter substrate-binding protein [Chloroflexota bacterium]
MGRRKLLTLAIGFLVVVGLVSSSCGLAPAAKDQITVAQGVDATTMDPMMHTIATTNNVLRHIYEPLIDRDQELKMQPCLAESWRAVNDKTWEFKLRKGVKFTNGEEFNAETVKFTVERVLDPATKARIRPNYTPIKEVKIIDPYTIQLITDKPFPILPAFMTQLLMMPPKYVKEKGNEVVASQPVGTGPYVLKQWLKDDKIILEANKDYWGKPPKIKTVIFRPIPENAARIAELKTGGVDVITNVPPMEAKSLEGDPNIQVLSAPSVRVIYIAIRCDQGGPLANPKVRQALNSAVDVDTIIKDLLLGQGYRIASPLTPLFFGYNPEVKPYPYDPERAKKLLAEAGYPNGFEVNFDTSVGRYLMDKEVAEAVAGYLAKVGVKANLKVLEWGVYTEMRVSRKVDPLYFLGWGNTTFDADGQIRQVMHSKGASSFYSNAALDKLLDEARFTIDEKKRLEDYHKASKLIHEEAPWIFLYQQVDIYAARKNVDWKPRSDELVSMYGVSFK